MFQKILNVVAKLLPFLRRADGKTGSAGKTGAAGALAAAIVGGATLLLPDAEITPEVQKSAIAAFAFFIGLAEYGIRKRLN